MELLIKTPDYSFNRPPERSTCYDILVTPNQQNIQGTFKGRELGLTGKEYIDTTSHNLEP